MVREVPVPGGRLTVDDLPGSTPPVLAIHGISSHRRLWNWLRSVDPGITLVAPDLRGRGDSLPAGGPFSMRRHAEDMIAVLDACGLDAVHVCGMSMGGFVAVELATIAPERVASLILVDGGPPMPTPPGLTEEALPDLFADRLGRLDKEWPTLDALLDFFTAETAPLLDRDDPLLRDYLEHDLRDGRVRLSGEALLADAADVFFHGPSIDGLTCPTRILCAEWSTGAGTPPAYSEEAIARFREMFVSAERVGGVDHAGSIMTIAGATATARAIREALA